MTKGLDVLNFHLQEKHRIRYMLMDGKPMLFLTVSQRKKFMHWKHPTLLALKWSKVVSSVGKWWPPFVCMFVCMYVGGGSECKTHWVYWLSSKNPDRKWRAIMIIILYPPELAPWKHTWLRASIAMTMTSHLLLMTSSPTGWKFCHQWEPCTATPMEEVCGSHGAIC